jgi:transcriptional regulator with XRE-family HTH domain
MGINGEQQKEDTMSVSINPAALKAHRIRNGWTQAKLADLTRKQASLATIKRIEGTEECTYAVRSSVAEGLAKALGVTEEQLSRAPTKTEENEAALKEFGYRPLRTMLDADTAFAFSMVERLYRIPVKSQIAMAPLFTALLAEASLSWRRERVAQIKDAAERLMRLGGGHFSFADAANRSLDGAAS